MSHGIKNGTPSQEFLLNLFSYDKETGIVTWRNCRTRTDLNGSRAGNITSVGYRQIRINGTSYAEHRIIFKMVEGRDAADNIDHKDRDRSNNKWKNLREATHGQNIVNTPPRGKSGVRGVSKRANGKYLFQYSVSRLHDTLEAAVLDSETHYRKTYGEFVFDPSNDNHFDGVKSA